MEDEKGLDLSLGLPCGGNSSSHKSKQGSSSDIKSEEGDRGSKLINEFKNFLEGGSQQHPLQVGEGFNYDFPKPAADVETSRNSNAEGLWSDEKASSVGEKRKSLFDETNQQKKHERETGRADLAEKPKTSHISITTDEGSTADNEDVADSEVDGSTSRHVPLHDDIPKRFASAGGVSRVQIDSNAFGDSSGVEILGQKRFTISSEKDFNMMNMHPAPPANMNISSYSQPVKDSTSSGTPNPSKYSMPSMVHSMATPNTERPVMPPNFPLMYGYPPVELPVLDRDNSRGIVSHYQQINPTYSGRNANPDNQNDGRKLTHVLSNKSSETAQFDPRVVEPGKSYGKQQVGEEGSSSRTGSDPKANQAIHQGKDVSDQQHRADSLPSEFPAIRPGVAADLKFGGCGSYPNLPWVSTSGSGPNGRTISGVTYKYSPTQIKIVCACHGSHMSPDEFIQHASEESNSPDGGTGLASLSGNNPAASAQS